MIKAIKKTLEALIPDSPRKALLGLTALAGLYGFLASPSAAENKPDNVVCKDGVCWVVPVSKNDSKLIFGAFHYKSDPQIYSINYDGNNLEKVTNGLRPFSNSANSGIFFYNFENDKSKDTNLYIIDRNKVIKALIKGIPFVSALLSGADCSPKGDKIAYESLGEIFIVDKEGIVKKLTDLKDKFYMNPRWLNENELVLLGKNKRLQLNDFVDITEIYRLNTDTKIIKKILAVPKKRLKGFDVYPTYKDLEISHDGKKIVFVSNINPINQTVSKEDSRNVGKFVKNDEVYISDIDGKNIDRLTYNEFSEKSPCFSPDDKKIAFVMDGGEDNSILAADIKNKELNKITSFNKKSLFIPSLNWYSCNEDKADLEYKVVNLEYKESSTPKWCSQLKEKQITGSKDLKISNQVVEIYTSWCGYCPAYTKQVFEPTAKKYLKKGIEFAVMNLDANEETKAIGKLYGIKGVPTTLFFKDGKFIDMITGDTDIKTLKKKIKDIYSK
jgi:thioredoxin 1